MSYICDVITIDREGDFTSVGIYMVLCFVEVVSGGYAMGRQCGLSQFFRSACASFSTYYCLIRTISRS